VSALHSDTGSGAFSADDVLQMSEKYVNHDSIIFIKNNVPIRENFHFNPVSVSETRKRLCKLDKNKSTGNDQIPPKLLKAGADVLCYPISYLINKSITDLHFPSALKRAMITPIHKKGDNMCKDNYRFVSVLSSISKVFEGPMIVDQMSSHFENYFSNYLSGFRKRHNCQDVLLRFNQCVKGHLDDGHTVGVVLTDLSKAFDYLPHDLLISKMRTYSVDDKACAYIKSYLTDRPHCVKLGNTKSDWLVMSRGAPQGSVLGPFLYNTHSNDLLLEFSRSCQIFNYADDNTICCFGNSKEEVKNKLQREISNMNIWFTNNGMSVNANKFQMILFDKSNCDDNDFITVDSVTIRHQPVVKLLGVYFDTKLNFSYHINEICRKAGKKLCVLARLSKSLDTKSKLTLFHAFILTHFEYCAVVWHFCSMNDMKRIEKIQKQALRYVYSDFKSSYTDLRIKSDRPLMYTERLRSILKQVYRCINDLGPKYMTSIFKYNEGSRSHNILQLHQHKFKTNKYGFNSFQYQGSRLWNGIENKFKLSNNFKNSIKKWSLLCNCNCCNECILKHV
jgi:hypothetical protein